MLIIPAENAVNWKRPPWVTLSLIMACLLVFLFYQGGDDQKLEYALEQYIESGLLALEAPAYEDYLQREIRFEGDQKSVLELQDFQQLQGQNNQLWQAVTLLMDREYYQYLQDNTDIIWAPAERRLWVEQRTAIEDQWISQMSAFQLGLVPAELSLYTLISYQFLHGGWGHIIGNLLFLFLLGFTVERALGPGRFLVAYLV
ncbi:MAG: rhomboid family intramembrane serine protease, partial [Marinobacter sp.]